MSDEDSDNDNDVHKGRHHKTTQSSDRAVIFFACRASMQDGVLKRGIFQELAEQMGFTRKTVSRQWNQMQKKLAPLLNNQDEAQHPTIIQQNADVLFGTGHASRRKGKHKYDHTELKVQVKALAFKQRKTVRKTAGRLAIPKSTLQDILKPPLPKKMAQDLRDIKGSAILVRHRSKLKPTLTELNKLTRFNFVLEEINAATRNLVRPRFKDQMDKVHIDEKWFYLCKDGEKYILVDDEEPPERYVKHKNFIGKVMFLCAQARPRWDPTTHSMWDGKLGIWPIGKYTVAQRRSVNRPAGTIEWENETIDNESYRDLLVNHVLVEIMNKWPVGQFVDPNFVIRVQQDGAGGHCSHDDPYLLEAIEELGLTHKVKFYTQPANSPDLNICDLGLFNAVQAAYYEHAPGNPVEIIAMVEQTYADYDYKKINRLFITLQSVFNEILCHHGGNNYKIPHDMNKDKLERENRLPVALQLTMEALAEVPAVL
jgi:hypothetical protein